MTAEDLKYFQGMVKWMESNYASGEQIFDTLFENGLTEDQIDEVMNSLGY